MISIRIFRVLFGLLIGLMVVFAGNVSSFGATSTSHGDLEGTVMDSSNGQVLEGCHVGVFREEQVIASTFTDKFGRFIVHNLAPGNYTVKTQYFGFQSMARSFSISEDGETKTVVFRLPPTSFTGDTITVTAQAPIAVETRTGDQVFQAQSYHGAPTTTTSQILQQSIAGAAKAPTGEVHIRGQHAEYTYYVDGIPVSAGISGSLNELFDPAIVGRIDFQTGGWDAEYGGKNAAIINVQTKIPLRRRADLSLYGGSFHSNGQTLNLSDNLGKWGWLVSGTRQESRMRQEPVVADSVTGKAINFHNYGKDYSGFGKVQWMPSNNNIVNLSLNGSQTHFQVPYDSGGGAFLDDRQKDANQFVNLGWSHLFEPGGGEEERSSDLFAGVYYRHGSLKYIPGAADQPSFIFYPDTVPYNLSEDRSFHTAGLKLDYRFKQSHELEFKVGGTASTTGGHELFETFDSSGNHGPVSDSKLKGHDFGVYGQMAVMPSERFELRAGVRYDAHTAPFAGTKSQVSPRVKLSLFPNPSNTFYAYYGRLFMPTSIEDLRAITSRTDSGVVADPTLPERDHFFELGYIHRFPFGVVTKLSSYHKRSKPGMDDNTVPGSAITTSVNLAEVRTTGIEVSVDVHPNGPVSGYLNLAVAHAYGRGPITGGFFPTDVADVPGGWFDLDHDQRISSVGSVTYTHQKLYLSATGIYGSGLTNGADIAQPIGRGLFDRNSDIHVKPSFILNASAGYSLAVGGTIIQPQVYVDNLLNKKYLLKGAFFSGASVGRPRSVQFRMNVGV